MYIKKRISYNEKYNRFTIANFEVMDEIPRIIDGCDIVKVKHVKLDIEEDPYVDDSFSPFCFLELTYTDDYDDECTKLICVPSTHHANVMFYRTNMVVLVHEKTFDDVADIYENFFDTSNHFTVDVDGITFDDKEELLDYCDEKTEYYLSACENWNEISESIVIHWQKFIVDETEVC